MDDSLFFTFPPKCEKVVKWGSGSFEFYLLVRVISSWMPFDPGPFKGCYSVYPLKGPSWCAKRFYRGETLKHPFQTDAMASSCILVESIEGWSKKQDKTSKQTSAHETNKGGRSKRSLHESQGQPRGERDVIRLRNPTEDKRAFRRMLTSADRFKHNEGYGFSGIG